MKLFGEFISEASLDVYRGIGSKYNPSYKQAITWVSTSEEHSRNHYYSPEHGEFLKFKLKIPSEFNMIDLGFRISETQVNYKEVSGRLIDSIMDKFSKGKISKSKARSAVDMIRNTKISGFMPIYEMMSKKEILKILKAAEYSVIRQREQISASTPIVTYGVIDKSLLKLKK